MVAPRALPRVRQDVSARGSRLWVPGGSPAAYRHGVDGVERVDGGLAGAQQRRPLVGAEAHRGRVVEVVGAVLGGVVQRLNVVGDRPWRRRRHPRRRRAAAAVCRRHRCVRSCARRRISAARTLCASTRPVERAGRATCTGTSRAAPAPPSINTTTAATSRLGRPRRGSRGRGAGGGRRPLGRGRTARAASSRGVAASATRKTAEHRQNCDRIAAASRQTLAENGRILAE